MQAGVAVQVLEPGIPIDKYMKLSIKKVHILVIINYQKGLAQMLTFGMRGGGPDCSVETVTDGAGTIGSDSLLEKHTTILQTHTFLGKKKWKCQRQFHINILLSLTWVLGCPPAWQGAVEKTLLDCSCLHWGRHYCSPRGWCWMEEGC